jgi:hypothetical protein
MSKPVVVGKRVKLGAVVTSIVSVLSYFFPQYSAAIAAVAVPVTAILQVVVANKFGITTE